MNKLILLLGILISSMSYGYSDCDHYSANYSLRGEFCMHIESNASSKSYSSESVFSDYFARYFDSENIIARSYVGDDEDSDFSMVLEAGDKKVYVTYEVNSNGADFDVDEHSICVIKSCSFL